MIFIILITALAALGIGVASWVQTDRLKRRFGIALGSELDASLETTLATHMDNVKKVEQRLAELEAEYGKLVVTNSLASQKISIVRFNPFGDTGGDQSFSLAVLDAQDSGYVLTSIHGRQGTRVYVKPVDFGKSKYKLSSEEQQSLNQAIKRVPKLD